MFGSLKYRAMLTELTRGVVRIAEKRGTALESFDPSDPSGFTQNTDQDAADKVFEILYEHCKGSAKEHSGMWRDIAVRTSVRRNSTPCYCRFWKSGMLKGTTCL